MSLVGTVKVELAGIQVAKSTVAVAGSADCNESFEQSIASIGAAQATNAAKA